MSPNRAQLIEEVARFGVRLQPCQKDHVDGYFISYTDPAKWLFWLADDAVDEWLFQTIEGIENSRLRIAENLRHRQDVQRMIAAIESGKFGIKQTSTVDANK